MRIKLRVFLLLSIPLFLMITVLFSSLAVSFSFSVSLVTEMSENMYASQQVEVQSILQANVFQFNSIFQRISINLQAITNFEAKILKGEVNLNHFFVDEFGNNEKLINGSENPMIQAIFDSQKDKAYNWYNKDTIELEELDLETKSEMFLTGYKSLLSRVIKYSTYSNINTSRNLEIKDIYEGFSHSGNIYGNQFSVSLKSFIPPPNCPYIGQYNYDVRCRQWFLEASQRERITPIEPIYYYSEVIPFLGTNLCQKQNTYLKGTNGGWIKNNCPYSVNCLNIKLTEVSNYFIQSSFKSSKSIMVDPRSNTIVVNQLSNSTNNITFLQSVGIQLFPNDEVASTKFTQEIEKRILRKSFNFSNTFKFEFEESSNNEYSECEINPSKIQQKIQRNQLKFEDYETAVKNINLFGTDNDQTSFRQSFLLNSEGEEEEIFISLNLISIFEKVKNEQQTAKLGYNAQDLFVTIDVLPKHILAIWTIQFKQQINKYLFYFGISSIVICILLVIITGKISYQVGLMIETPLIHMTDLLKKLQNEGGESALDLIYRGQQLEEQIFLSKDSKILYESLKTMIQMLSLAAVDIFKVDNTSTLLRLNYQINFFKQFNNKRIQGICSNNMGNIHFQNGRYLESMEYYHQAIILANYEAEIYEEMNPVQLKDEQVQQKQEIGFDINLRKYSYVKNNPQQKRESDSTFEQSISEKKILSQQFQNSEKKNDNKGKIIQQIDNSESIAETIKETIFERKLNFSQALFMHNISQEKEYSLFNSNMTTKVLNNPTKYQQINHSQIVIDWLDYEKILLNLIELNQQLIAPSFGRNVILLTQLSLCHLKMGKIELAANEQTLAIDNYECALALENLRKKNKLIEKQSYQYQHQFLSPSKTISYADLKGKISEVQGDEIISSFSLNPSLSNEAAFFNQIQTMNSQKNMQVQQDKPPSLTNTNRNSGQEQENSLINLFKSRQLETRRRISCSQNILNNQSNFISPIVNSSHILKQELQALNLKNIQQQALISSNEIQIKAEQSKTKSIKKSEPKNSDDCSFSFLSKKSFENNQLINSSSKKSNRFQSALPFKQQKQNLMNTSKNLFEIKHQISTRQNSKSLQQQQIDKQNNIQQFIIQKNSIRIPSISDPVGTSIKEKLKGRENEENLILPITTSQIFKQEMKLNESVTKYINPYAMTEKSVSSNSKKKRLNHQINSPSRRYSIFSTNTRKQQNSFSEKEKIQERRDIDNNSKNIILTSQIQTMPEIQRRQIHTKTNKAILKSKINKNLKEEDSKQILRYELPCDILLYYIGIQEGRLLLSENKHEQASHVLTDLFEKSKQYHPYYRLTCLNVLKSILMVNKLNTSLLDKMQNKFDNDITLRVSTIIAVKENHKIAGQICMDLVSEVLTNEKDMFSLLLNYEQNFEQIIPLISMKQLLSSGNYLDYLLLLIQGDSKQRQKEFSSFNCKNNNVDDENKSNSNTKKKSSFLQYDDQQLEQYQSEAPPPNQTLNSIQSSPLKLKKMSLQNEFNQNVFIVNSQTFVRSNDISPPLRSQFSSRKLINQNQIKNISIDQLKKGEQLNENKNEVPFDQFFTLQTDNESSMCILTEENLPKLKYSASLSHKASKIISSSSLNTEPQQLKMNKQFQSEKYFPLQKSLNRKDRSLSPLPITFSNLFKKKIRQQNNLNTIHDLSQLTSSRDCHLKLNSFEINMLKQDKQEEEKKKNSFNNQYNNPFFNQIDMNSMNEMENFTHRNIIQNDNYQMNEDIFTFKNFGRFSNRLGHEKVKFELLSQLPNNKIDSSDCSKTNSPILQKEEYILKEKINLIFHLAVRQSILNFFNSDVQKYKMQKKLTELKIQSKQKKILIFITDQIGIINNKAYKMLQQLLYSTQTELLILQLNDQEQLKEQNQLSDSSINDKSIIRFFYTQDKLLQYVINKREPMKNFDVPLMVEHFSI